MFEGRGIIFFTVTDRLCGGGVRRHSQVPPSAWRKCSVTEEHCLACGSLTVGSGPPIWLVRLRSMPVPGVEGAVSRRAG